MRGDEDLQHRRRPSLGESRGMPPPPKKGLGNAISSIFCNDLIRREMQLVSYCLLYPSLELSVRYIL